MLMHATMAALAVFICFAGNYLTGQSMMERPLVVGLVTGILMGDMKTGVLMGASLEAIFLGNVNIGGVIAAEPVTATDYFSHNVCNYFKCRTKSRHDVSRTNWDVSRFRGDVFKKCLYEYLCSFS